MVQSADVTSQARSIVGRFRDLAGKRALVTAGSAGIGRAVAMALNENGVIVTVLARRKQRLDPVVQQLNGGHGVIGDLFKVDEIDGYVQEAIQKMGGLDILVNTGA